MLSLCLLFCQVNAMSERRPQKFFHLRQSLVGEYRNAVTILIQHSDQLNVAELGFKAAAGNNNNCIFYKHSFPFVGLNPRIQITLSQINQYLYPHFLIIVYSTEPFTDLMK